MGTPFKMKAGKEGPMKKNFGLPGSYSATKEKAKKAKKAAIEAHEATDYSGKSSDMDVRYQQNKANKLRKKAKSLSNQAKRKKSGWLGLPDMGVTELASSTVRKGVKGLHNTLFNGK